MTNDVTPPEQRVLLHGAAAITAYLGLNEKTTRHLIAQRRIPVFRIGATIYARVQSIDQWLIDEERRQLEEEESAA